MSVRPRVLVARTDNAGDVLLAGPAVRAAARTADVSLLVSPTGAEAARLLPGVRDVLVHPAPWSGDQAPAVDADAVAVLVQDLRRRRFDRAVVLTSFHQSALPLALLLRLAGVARITAASTDHPGSLLDGRVRPPEPHDSRHEVQRALDTMAAAGYPPAADADDRLAVRRPLRWPAAVPQAELPRGRYVVVHAGASVPARAIDPRRAAGLVLALREAGWLVAATGGPAEVPTTALLASGGAVDLGGRTTLAGLASVLDRAACVVAGNSGPAHLAAAVGTPVVSLFAPVVPAAWWRPWGVPVIVLGDQQAACAGTRARTCPVPGHPCTSSVTPGAVVAAVRALAGDPAAEPVRAGAGVR